MSYQEKVLEIYSIFSDCYWLMHFDEFNFLAKLGYYSKLLMPVEATLKQREIIARAYNEAELIFDGDGKLTEVLKELCNGYMSLSTRFLNLAQNATALSQKAFTAVANAFPELEPIDLTKILNHPQACALFGTMCTTDETAQWENDAVEYFAKFSYEKFDVLFKKHLILKKL